MPIGCGTFVNNDNVPGAQKIYFDDTNLGLKIKDKKIKFSKISFNKLGLP